MDLSAKFCRFVDSSARYAFIPACLPADAKLARRGCCSGHVCLVHACFSLGSRLSIRSLWRGYSFSLRTWLSAAPPQNLLPWLIAAGGLLLGLSVDTRSYLLLLIPLFLWWIFHTSDTGARLTSILWFLGGFTIAMVPCLYFFISSPDAFLFNNLGYHAIRSNAGLIGMWQDKLAVVFIVFLVGPQGNGIQNSILFFISLGFVFSMGTGRYPPRLAFQIAVVWVSSLFSPRRLTWHTSVYVPPSFW